LWSSMALTEEQWSKPIVKYLWWDSGLRQK
jgi:hypothetical protein